MKNSLCISKVKQGSIAGELGISAGDVLLTINGRKARDLIDYEYHMAGESLLMELQDSKGAYEVEIEKEAYEDIGLEFADDGLKRKIVCQNKCLFCFVDQMPPGMRKSLYFKDDDWRLSFLMGSYITLTNLSDEEFERIVEQGISPLYVSVHACKPDLRSLLLGSYKGASSLERLTWLADRGIEFHTQVVMCEGLNSNEALQQTLDALYVVRGVKTVTVVPVGLTSHREGLYPLKVISQECAADAITRVERLQAKSLKENGTCFAYASDEMYIRANMEMPPYESYGSFENLENGVGMVAKFMHESNEALKSAKIPSVVRKIAVVTGVDFYPFMKDIAGKVSARTAVMINVYPVENNFFGSSVTVTGLLTGKDIISQLKGRLYEDSLLICENCFREGTSILLDDITLEDLSRELGIKCEMVAADGYGFIEKITGEDRN